MREGATSSFTGGVVHRSSSESLGMGDGLTSATTAGTEGNVPTGPKGVANTRQAIATLGMTAFLLMGRVSSIFLKTWYMYTRN
jgi:hypothetical protein